jgi:Clp amino terminal domain, pathogenicity island component
MWLLPALIQGLVAGIVSLVVLAGVAASQGRAGVTFVELLTAAAVGVSVGFVSALLPRVIEWQVRRTFGRSGGAWFASHAIVDPGGSSVDPVASSDVRSHERDRFDQFTDQARHVLTLAQDEAQRFNHNYIGTEHLLLGLVREGQGVAAHVLENMNVELAKVRTAVEFIIGRGDREVAGEIGLTPDAKRVIELAIDEARLLGHHYIGTEHLLLGLVRVRDGVAGGVLESFGVTRERAGAAVLEALERGNAEG